MAEVLPGLATTQGDAGFLVQRLGNLWVARGKDPTGQCWEVSATGSREEAARQLVTELQRAAKDARRRAEALSAFSLAILSHMEGGEG